MTKDITVGSLFDGIGGWPLATVKCGAIPLWSSEIEKFPSAVTAERFPKMVPLGDITKLNGATIPPVDIICAGSPCQDLSVAGSQAGLSGERSGLFVTAFDIVRDMRRATGGKYPKVFIWENVPGAYSSNKGADFRAVLSEIAETDIPIPKFGKWARAGMVKCKDREISWRTLDAQYWGVPQRRDRIFLVCHFGAESSGEILFKPKSVSRYTKHSGKETQDLTRNAEERFRKSSVYCINGHIIGRKESNGGNGFGIAKDVAPHNNNRGSYAVMVYDPTHACDVIREYKNRTPTLSAIMGTGGGNIPLVINRHTAIRRLTPLECERLQGLPDNWTLTDDKSCSDSARYKAIGNGMAQPCADFVMRRVIDFLRRT